MNSSDRYDVVIMGAGFAGICQARHLLLKAPNLKVALVDPRPPERRDKDMKVGESTVEIASQFMCRELGLQDYLVENHVMKLGLSFHWPKRPDATQSLDDYLHVWTHNQPFIATFQLNRATFERDVLAMTRELGADFIQGHVMDLDLPPGDALNAVHVKTEAGPRTLHARHVVDAAGRRFIIGKKKDNLIFDSEDLYGLNNGSAWMRLRGVDRTRFHSGYDPCGATFVSKYYATNQFFGHGHWVWMIPTRHESNEVSIGVVYHKNAIAPEQLSSREKLLSFLRENHRVLYDFACTGEPVDFFHWSRIAHASKEMFSRDNWYVIGDAAFLYDAFYSYGTSVAALAIESVTEIIRADLAGESGVEEKRAAYNAFNLVNSRLSNLLIRGHDRQLGAADVMSWRVYFDYMWWFGLLVPLHSGKWHLDVPFLRWAVPLIDRLVCRVFDIAYDELGQLVENEGSLGLMDCYRSGQLFGRYVPTMRFDDYLENAKHEPQRLNVFKSTKWTAAYAALWYFKLMWKGRGVRGVLNPRRMRRLLPILAIAGAAAAGDAVFRWKYRNVPANSAVDAMRREFESYKHEPQLKAWSW